MSKPYRKHRWETYTTMSPYRMRYERCADCLVTRWKNTEDAWCPSPRDERYAPYGQEKEVTEAESRYK